MISYNAFGSGPQKVLVMHSWFCDNSSYAPLLPFIDPNEFTFLFMDLRGYGNSKEVNGKYTLQEAVEDAIRLTSGLNWNQFHILSHSMSTLIAQKIAITHEQKVKSLIGINPIPPCGLSKSMELLSFLQEAALSNESSALEGIHVLTNRKYSEYIAKKIVINWHNCSTSKARMAYLEMFAKTNFTKEAKGLKTPMLLIFGEDDYEEQEEALQTSFLKLYSNAQLNLCKNAGHFPMQETPPLIATLITNFIYKNKT